MTTSSASASDRGARPEAHPGSSGIDSADVPVGTARLVSDVGQTIEYHVSGTGPVVVLLPALATSVAEFNALAATLNDQGFRTIGIQLPGVGQSWRRFRPPPTLHDFADGVRRVLVDAGVASTERVFLLGRALGNRIARAFATRYPAQVAGIVLLAAGGKVASPAGKRLLLRYLALQLPGLPIPWRRKILESVICTRRNVLPDFACRRPSLRAFVMQSKAARRTAVAEWWSGGDSPLLVLQGEQDQVADPENARQLQREFPERVELKLIPDAGHALTYDCPAVVEREVLAFLQRLSQVSGATSAAARS